MKRLTISLLLLGSAMAVLVAKDLNVYLEGNRFLTPNGDTRFELIFQIPYSEMQFNSENDKLQSHVNVVASLEQGGVRQEFYNTTYTQQAQQEGTTRSRTQNLTDRITIVLASPMKFILQVTDENSGATKNWETEIPLLTDTDIISDIDFSNLRLDADSTAYPLARDPEPIRAWKKRLIRDGEAIRLRPDHIFGAMKADSICYFYQAFHLGQDEDGIAAVQQVIEVKGDTTSLTYVDTVRAVGDRYDRYAKLPLVDLPEGRYDFILTVTDLNSKRTQSVSDYFMVQHYANVALRVFPKLDDEFTLMHMLDTSLSSGDWNNLSNEGKLAALQKFWTSRDPSPGTPENEYFDIIQKRVDYANEKFSVYGHGWLSDRGKVYIVWGAPDDISKGTTADTAQDDNDNVSATPRSGTLGTRDYQIWKYYLNGRQASFLFLDMHSNGSMKLLLKKENGNYDVYYANWEKVMGSDFNTNQLD